MFLTREEEKEQEELFKLEDAEFTYLLQDVEEVVIGITDCIKNFLKLNLSSGKRTFLKRESFLGISKKMTLLII